MSELRALIREILAEEIAALRSERPNAVREEQVQVESPADLTEFALSVLRRASDPAFAEALRDGLLRFIPQRSCAGSSAPAPASIAPPHTSATKPVTLVTTVPACVAELTKGLITERDIAGIAEGETRLRIPKTARLTPLARDEARRRGIRLERKSA